METISYIGYKKDFYTGKIDQYISEIFSKKGNDFSGIIYKFMYINKYPYKEKGWVKIISNPGQWFSYLNDIFWEEGTVNLNVKKEINESIKLVKESLNEELLGRVTNSNTEIYKNPPSIKRFDKDVRAISDDKGNLFVCDSNMELIHPNMYYWLVNNDYMKRYKVMGSTNAWDVMYDYNKVIFWQRMSDSNSFYLGESYNIDKKISAIDYENLEKLANKVRQKNPQFLFIVKQNY